jgi:filamentous hemagglutinin family protein
MSQKRSINKALLFTISLYLLPVSTLAQEAPISSDGTVPTDVNQQGNVFEITGGAQAGSNLFHSFSNFSVPNGGEAFFNNASDINNIISRVTGGKVSDINGLIRANGSANLFLINPAGIVFGPNASLNIGGSFLGSTADSLLFSDGTEFSATNSQGKPLLTINAPIGLNLRDNPESIVNRSVAQNPNGETNVTGGNVGLQVKGGQTLALIGGDVLLDDGNLTAKGGRIEIGSVQGSGNIAFNSTENGLVFDYSSINSFGDINLENTAVVDVTAGGGGDIVITGQNIGINNSSLNAGILSNLGSEDAQAGNINLNASDAVAIDSSFVNNRVGLPGLLGIGNAGNITITTGSLSLTNGSDIDSSTYGRGNAGNITINATDGLDTDSLIRSNVETGAVGNGGQVKVDTGTLNLFNGGQILTIVREAQNNFPAGEGIAGDVIVNARGAVTLDGAFEDENNNIFRSAIFSSLNTGAKGKAGNLEINSESLTLTNGARINSSTAGVGDGGNITINTGSLSATKSSQIVTFTNGQGDAGNVTVTARDRISFDGRDENDSFPSGIFTDVNFEANGKGGDINIDTGSLSITNRAQLSSTTYGLGNAGNISIKARDEVSLVNSILISEISEEGGVGKGGDIKIDTGSLILKDGSALLADTENQGDAGSITINARDRIVMEGKGLSALATDATDLVASQISSTTNPREVEIDIGSKGGDISISTGTLSIADDGFIKTSTFGKGNAGDLTISASQGIQMTKGGLISSGVEEGASANAGNIEITSGFLTLTNDAEINSSTKGKGDAGNITVNAKDNVSLDRSTILSTVEAGAVGNGGQIQIDTGNFSLTNEGRIATSVSTGDLPPDIGNPGGLIAISPEILEKITNSGIGNAGDVIINARGNVNLDNNGSIAIASSLFPGATGKAGNIKITSDSLALTNVTQILSDTSGNGDAGNININVRGAVTLDGTVKLGERQISSSISSGVGPTAKGKAGNIDLTAKTLSLTNGYIDSRTFGIGSEGGNINLNIDDTLTMRNNSQISAQALNNANGGNITINAPNGFVVAFPNQNNDIIATAQAGKGGQININAQSIYGFDRDRIQSIEVDPQNLLNNGKNDINSTSANPQLSGTINLNTQLLDPAKRTTQSSENLVEPDETVAQACSAGSNGELANSFSITGRGGMPPSPTEPLNSSIIAGDSRRKAQQPRRTEVQENRSEGAEEVKMSDLPQVLRNRKVSSDEIIPARGIAINDRGQIVLTRYPTPNVSQRHSLDGLNCENYKQKL